MSNDLESFLTEARNKVNGTILIKDLESYIMQEYAKIKKRMVRRQKGFQSSSAQYAQDLDQGRRSALKEMAKHFGVQYK